MIMNYKSMLGRAEREKRTSRPKSNNMTHNLSHTGNHMLS